MPQFVVKANRFDPYKNFKFRIYWEGQTVPVAVTGENGRFTHWPRFESLDFRPTAHVFHLRDKNQTNLELTWQIDVVKPAPAYLTSA